MAVLKIPAEIIYTDLKCPQTTQETNSTFCWSKRQKFFANVRTLSPATTFPHPFHLRKLHQQCWALPVIIPGSIHLYLCILFFFFFHFFYAILPVKPTLPPAPRKSLYSLLNPLKTFPKKFPIHGTPGAPVPWFHNFYLNLAVTSPANTSKDCLLTMAFENVKHLRLCSLNTDIHLRHAIWKIITWFSRSN